MALAWLNGEMGQQLLAQAHLDLDGVRERLVLWFVVAPSPLTLLVIPDHALRCFSSTSAAKAVLSWLLAWPRERIARSAWAINNATSGFVKRAAGS